MPTFTTIPAWRRMPLPIVIVSALNVALDVDTKHTASQRALLRESWPADTDVTIEQFLKDEDRLAAAVGGRDVLRAFAEEQVKLRTESLARLAGALDRVTGRAEDLQRRSGDDQEVRELRVLGGVLLKSLEPIRDGLTLPEALHTVPAVLGTLDQHAKALAGNGFPKSLRDRIAALAEQVEADQKAFRSHALARELATQEVQQILERVVRFLATYTHRVDTLRRDGHHIPGAEFAEAHHWEATRASELKERAEREAREAALPQVVRDAVSAFRAEAPVDDGDTGF